MSRSNLQVYSNHAQCISKHLFVTFGQNYHRLSQKPKYHQLYRYIIMIFCFFEAFFHEICVLAKICDWLRINQVPLSYKHVKLTLIRMIDTYHSLMSRRRFQIECDHMRDQYCILSPQRRDIILRMQLRGLGQLQKNHPLQNNSLQPIGKYPLLSCLPKRLFCTRCMRARRKTAIWSKQPPFWTAAHLDHHRDECWTTSQISRGSAFSCRSHCLVLVVSIPLFF